MNIVTETAIQKATRGIFTRLEAECWLKEAGDSLNSRLKRAVASEEVLRITRGLYCLHHRYLKNPIHPFELAQHIHGPSYISQESALSFHNWIPEAVYTITNTTLSRTRSFDTPLSRYDYTRVPQKTLFCGVQRIDLGQGRTAFVASPLKALADYVYVHKLSWTGITPILENLRVETEEIKTLTAQDFEVLQNEYSSRRVRTFLKGLQKDLLL